MPNTTLEAPPHRRPELRSVDGRTYPLRSAQLTARAEGGLATSRLAQVFTNPHEQALEVIYAMPLPAEGAVLGYTVRIGERLIRGVVEPREKAAVAFKKALAEGRSAGLLEQNRDDTFQQRLGNIPPKTNVEVEIEVLQPLAALAATDALGPQWEFRFPTVVGIRYQGAPGRVPDAESLDVDRTLAGDLPTRLEIDVTVADPAANQIASPSHSIACEPVPSGTRVRLGEGERLDRDLVLRWNACEIDAGARLLSGGGLPGDDGRYGLVTVTPPVAPQTTLPRDVTVLIDASGSMSGQPIGFAKQVVKELLVSLDPGDRFELLAFANEVRSLTGPMGAATPDSVRRAQAALEALEAGGGTEMAHAIQEALKPLRHDAQRQVVFVTDGQIGFEREILGHLMNGLPVNSRAHAVGIGVANRTLTAGVARAGRGVELLVSDPITARDAARRLCVATTRPVITEVTIEGTALLRPATNRLRDVFAGQPMLAAVELRREGGALEVRGHLAGSAEPWVRTIEVPAREAPAAGAGESSLPIGVLFGRERIADLELTLAAAQTGTEEIDARIEALGMRHRITSRRTSLIAIAEEPSVEPGAEKRTERLALEMPAGVSAEYSGLMGGGLALCGSLKLSSRPPHAMRADLLGLAMETLSLRRNILRGLDPVPPVLAADRRSSAEELRDSLERLVHEREALSRAIQEKLPRLQAAAEALVEFLAKERQRYDLLEAVLPLKSRQLKELLERLRQHIDSLSRLAQLVVLTARDWSEDVWGAGPRSEELRVVLDQIAHGGLAQEYRALEDELNALLAAESPKGH